MIDTCTSLLPISCLSKIFTPVLSMFIWSSFSLLLSCVVGWGLLFSNSLTACFRTSARDVKPLCPTYLSIISTRLSGTRIEMQSFWLVSDM